MKNTDSIHLIEEDEIDLRELFATIGRYKWSILFFTTIITFAVAVKVYFMPKYYKSTVMLEVKTEDGKSSGLSLGGAGALLGLGSAGGGVNLERDVTLFKTFRTNQEVLNKTNSYMIRYFIEDEKYKEVEIEKNISIEITDVKIDDSKKYGLRVIVKPLTTTEYQLSFPGRFSNELLGKFHYSEMVKTEDFSLMVHKKSTFTQTYTVELSGTKHYIYENTILPNLTIEMDKNSPFLTLSYLDTIPSRGEEYLKNLIEVYTQQNISDIQEDASIEINSYNKQLKNIALRVDKSSRVLENFKQSNNIVSPSAQAGALIAELTNVEIQISKNSYKEELIKSLITFVKKNKNIDAIAPSLIELQDKPTITLIEHIQEYQLNLSSLLLKYNHTHPNIVNIKQKIHSLKSKILSNLKNLQTTLKSKTESLNKMLNGYKSRLKDTPKQEQKLISFSRDYQLNSKLYTYLIQKRSQVELQKDKDLSRFRVIESIYTADKAVKPKKSLIVIVAFITSFILMIFVAFFREFLKGKRDESID